MKILLTILTIVILVILYPFVNRFMTQVIFKSKRRTRKRLIEAYNFYKSKYPNASEKELLLDVMRASFLILDKQPDSTKPAHLLTEKDAEEIVKKATNIETLIEIITEKGLSPDMAPWF